MKRTLKRMLSLTLVLCMFLSMLPTSVWAATSSWGTETDPVYLDVLDGEALSGVELYTKLNLKNSIFGTPSSSSVSLTASVHTGGYKVTGNSATYYAGAGNGAGRFSSDGNSNSIPLAHGVTYNVEGYGKTSQYVSNYGYWGGQYFNSSTALSFVARHYYNVAVSVSETAPANGGVASSDTQKVYKGNNATLTINKVDGYNVTVTDSEGNIDQVVEAADYNYTYTPSKSTTLTVKYVSAEKPKHNVTLVVNGDEYGDASLSASGQQYEDTAITLTAIPLTDTDSTKYTYDVAVDGATYDASTGKFTVGTEDVTVTVTFSKLKELSGNDSATLDYYEYEGTDALKKGIFDAVINSGASIPTGVTVDDVTVYFYQYHVGFNLSDLSTQGFNAGMIELGEATTPDDTTNNPHTYYDFGERFISDETESDNDALEKVRITGNTGTAWAGLFVEADITLAHTHTEVTDAAVAPGCESTGLTAGSHCSVCNEVIVEQEVVPVTGHTPGEAQIENNVAATCTTDGSYDTVVYCTECDAEVSRVTTTVPAKGHTNGEAVIENNVAATCTVDGSYETVVYCTECDVEVSREKTTVSATGHTPAAAVIENDTRSNTCGATGSYDEVVYCSVCTHELSRNTVQATGGHNYATETEREAATCTEDGYVIMSCSCGETQTTTLPATGHTAGATKIENNVAPTCTEDGSYDTVVYCAVEGCGGVFSKETTTVPATGHVYGYTYVKIDLDNHQVLCKKCNAKIKAEEAHSFNALHVCACEAVEHFNITWDMGGETKTDRVQYNTKPTAPTVTAPVNYVFAGWDKTVVEATEATTYTATFSLNAQNGTIAVNQYYAALSNANALENLRTNILKAAELEGDNFVITTTVGIQSMNITATVNVLDGTVAIVAPEWAASSDPANSMAAGVLAKELDGESYTFTITDSNTGASKNVTMSIVDSRNVTAEITCAYINGTGFDTEDAFKDAVKAAVTSSHGTPIVTVTANGDGTYKASASVVGGESWLGASKEFDGLTWTVNTYTVTWYDEDGETVVATKEGVPYGTAPAFEGNTPTKESTVDKVFTFDKWNAWENVDANGNITGAATYKASYTSAPRPYTVQYVEKDKDGNIVVWQTAEVAYGSAIPGYDNKNGTPTKESDDPAVQYTHSGWALTEGVPGADNTVAGNLTYTATFSTDTIHVITFKVDGVVYGEPQYINVTENPNATVADVADPDKEYAIFDGWDVDIIGKTPATDMTVNAKWVEDKNDNNVLDSTETGDIKVVVEGEGTVALTAGENAYITDNEDGTYTVLFDSNVSGSNVVTVTATPKDTDGKDGSAGYVEEAPATVTVEAGETPTEITVKFATQTLNGSNNGVIEANGYETASKLESVTKKAVLEAILGETLTDADLAEYEVKMYIQIATDIPVIGTISGYYDIWNVASWGSAFESETVQSFINSAIEKALDVPGTESFEVTWTETDKPEVKGIFTVKLEDSRLQAVATHNGDTYNATVLDDALLKAITEDLTADTTFVTAWAEDNPTVLEEGKYYDIKVTVTLGETTVYQGGTQTITVSVHVPHTVGSITIDEEANMTYNTSMTDSDKTAMVMEAVNPVFTPASLEEVDTTVWYKANEARTVPLVINFAAMDLGIYANFLPETATIQVPVSDMWLNIGDEFPETKAPTNEQIKDILLNDLIPNYGMDYVRGELETDELYAILALTLQENPDLKLYYEYLGAHKFGENEKTDENGNVLEYVYLSQADTGYTALQSNVSELTLADLREESSIKLNTGVTVTYNDYTAEELKAALVDGVYDAEGKKIDGAEVEFVTEVEGLPASEAMEVTVKFSGNTEYKGSTATGTIVINKAPVSVNIDSQVVKYGQEYKMPVVTDPAGVDTIDFIVGLDVSDVNVDGGKIKGIMGSVQLLLPDELQAMLIAMDDVISNTLGMDISFADGASMKLSELQSAMTALGTLFQNSDYSYMIDVLLNMLNSLPTETADIEVIVGGNMPTNIGVYLIGSVTADQNYETAFAVGALGIYPDGVKAEIDWVQDDENNIITRSLLANKVYDMSAEAVSVAEGGDLEKATEQIVEVFLGVDYQGNIILETDQTVLDVGAYTEIAAILNWGNQMYYSEPIIRAFVVVAESLDVAFIDENGNVNNDRLYTFDNEIQNGMENVKAYYKHDGAGYAAGDEVKDGNVMFFYAGVQTNGVPYASKTAPVHAGAYTVTAVYTLRDADNMVSHVGVAVGAMAIEPAASEVVVDNAAYKVDGSAHKVGDLVTATSAVKGLTPDTTVISAGITTDGTFSEKGLEAVEGTVNVDLPKWLDEVLGKLNILEAGYTDEGITLEVFNGYIATIRNTLTDLGMDTEAFDEVVSVIEQLPDNVTLTFHDDKAYASVGAYLIVAVVTDSDHYPDLGAGLMVIYPEATEVELKYDEDWNGNNVFTLDYLAQIDMGASAYDMTTGDLNEEATGYVHDLYVGVGTNNEIILTFDQDELVSGVYTELSFLLEVNSEMYYAEPITRAFIVAPNTAEVIFVDETGAENNDRIFTFTGAAHEMAVMVNGEVMVPGDELTVVYTGTSATASYVSTQAPTHAGAYTVTATYVGRDDKGQIDEAGIAVGAMVIEPAEATVSVDSQVVIEGNDYEIVVNTTDAAAYDDVKTLTILAGVDASTLNSLGLASVNSVVNLDFPAKVDEVLKKIVPAAYNGGISSQTLKDLRGDIIEALNTIGFDTAEYERTQAILEKMGDVTVTFKETEDAKPTAVGTYVIIASTFDPDYKAAMDVAMLVIAPDEVAVQLGFDMEIPGLLNIMPYELIEEFDFTASAVKAINSLGQEVDLNAVNPYVKDVIFGVTTDLELFFGDSANKPVELGIYDQLGYVENTEATSYVALPAFRTFTVVKSTADVKFYDENGYVNWIRKFTYDGEAHGMDACLVYADGTVAAQLPNVLYIGVEGNGTGYFSTEPPTEAGVYDVIGYYVSESENIYAVGFGAMMIEKATLEFDLTDTDVTYNGEEHFVNVVNPLGADYVTVIETENGANVIFPAELAALAEVLPAKTDLTGLKSALEAGASKLEGIEIDSDFISKLVEVIEELSAKLPVTVTVNGKNPVACGEYTAYAVTYSANYMSEAARGVLTIEHAGELENVKEATCGEEGYTGDLVCSCCGEVLQKGETIPMVAHEYGEPEFFWLDDNSRTVAVRTCVNDESHKDGATAESEAEVTTEPTCTAEGIRTYTAKFTFKNGDTVVGTKEVAIPALGHTEGEAVTENEVAATCTTDGSYDTVVYCTVCGEEISRETATVPAAGHTEGEAVTENEVAATCTTDGSYDTVVYCTVCEEEVSRKTISVDKLGHDYESVVTEPTCTKGGYTTHTCSDCGDIYKDTYTDPLDHEYETEVTAPTCTEGGYTTYTCTKGDHTYVSDYTDPKGHAYESEVTAPTCTEGGYTTYTCTRCDDTYKKDYTEPLDHNYETVVTEPTCTKGGYTTYTCAVCGDTHEDDRTDPKGHAYEPVVTDPTCTEAGYTTHTCSVCGDSYVDSYVDAKGHRWNEGEVTTPATGDEDGEMTYTCTECSETKTEVIQALGHEFDEGVVTKKPTCTDKGEMTYTCKNCEDHKTTEEIDALGHDLDEGTVTAPGCTEKGYTTYTCQRENCDYSVKDNYVDAVGHSHQAVVTEPTCTEKGYTTYTCHCGDTYKADYVDATGHEAEVRNAKAATCTEKGYTGDTYCKTCNEKLTTGTEIPALGHKPVTVGAKAATATTDGYTGDTVCETCGEVLKKGEVIPATGEKHEHEYTSKVTKEATCTKDGVKTFTCSCGNTYTEVIKAAGHKFRDWAPVNDPSCFVPEELERKCSVCGEVEKKTGDVDTTYCPSEENFPDIFKTEWYHEATDFVIVNGLMNGTGGRNFSPDMGASRAMIVTTLYRMEGSPAVSGEVTYPDVLDDFWYTDAIIWATQKGIVKGYGTGDFGPNDTVTREQIATIFQRYAAYKGMDATQRADLTAYPDDQDVSDWALEGVQWANKTGLITGRGVGNETYLAPKDGTIRTELATLLMRWCKEFAN